MLGKKSYIYNLEKGLTWNIIERTIPNSGKYIWEIRHMTQHHIFQNKG